MSGANVVVKTDTEWLVIAHEVGHTFGAVHDCDSTTCNDGKTVAAQQCCPLSTSTCPAGGKYVMNPSTSAGITNFSPCSIGNICSAIGGQSVKTSCLTSNRNVTTITGSQCGNGIVEMGEDCDCGGESGCGDNTCCNPTTCKFKTENNAVCDPSNEDCCLSTCQFATAGTVCRASTGECDPQETCSGTTASCPADAHAAEGDSCGSSGEGLSCASGQCTSRDKQCKTLMGSQYYECNNDDGCQLFCATDGSQYACDGLTQNFLDGTTCGGGGKCSNGVCKGSTVGGRIKEFVNDHKPLVIGLSVGVGGLLLLAILSCIVGSCKRRSRRRKYAASAAAAAPRMGGSGWAPQGQARGYAPVPVPPMQQRGMGPVGPPPQFEYGAGGQQYDSGAWSVPERAYGGPPVRYA